MKKGFFWVILSVILVGTVVFLGYLFTHNQTDSHLEELSQKTEGYAADVIVYGNLKETEKADIIFRRIDQINQQTLEGNSPNTYHLIILSDLDGKLNVSDEELSLLRDYCIERHYDMFYVGNLHMEQLVRCGFDTKVLPEECSMFFCGYQFKGGCPYTFDGEYWVNPEEPGTFYANPYIILTDITEEDLTRFQKDSTDLWKIILSLSSENLTN